MISDLKKVYSRRTKKEKILTVGVLACMVLVMLPVAARCSIRMGFQYPIMVCRRRGTNLCAGSFYCRSLTAYGSKLCGHR